MRSWISAHFLSFSIILASCILPSQGALAQPYPDKPIKLVVAYPAGGGADIVARLLATRLSKDLDWKVIVENRSGAAGLIGTESVAKAAPDGYTLIMGTNATHAIFASLYSKLPYDVIKDFEPVTNVVTVTSVLVINPAVPARSVKELIALAKSKPGQLNYASGGSGSNAHLAMELFNMMAGVNTVHVPYKGLAPAVTDLVAGQTQMMVSNMPPVLPFIKSGKLIALGMADPHRTALLPDVPTIAEAGVTGFKADLWWGVLAPAGTPRSIVYLLNASIRKILNTPEFKGQLVGIGAEPAGCTPEEFAATIQADVQKWARVVKASGAKAD